MVWFSVEDNLGEHPKVVEAGMAAMGLWVVCGSWSMRYLTEGFVPEWYVLGKPDGAELAGRLVQARLWHPAEKDGKKGWEFHDWADRQRTREQVERDREMARERQRRRRRFAVTNGVTPPVTDTVTTAVSHTTPALPCPSLPKKELKTSAEARKRAVRLPEDWKPGAAETTWQRSAGVSAEMADRELPKFHDYWAGIGGQRGCKLDWPATWRNWLRTALKESSNGKSRKDRPSYELWNA